MTKTKRVFALLIALVLVTATLTGCGGKKLKDELLTYAIPHHGENTSSSADFGAAVSAEIAAATGYMAMSQGDYYAYSKHGTRVLMDYTDGYIHISGLPDGTVQWETSRERATDFYAGLDKAAGLN